MHVSIPASDTPARPSGPLSAHRLGSPRARLAALLVIALGISGSLIPAGRASGALATSPAALAALRARSMATFSARPLAFEPNRGQAPRGIAFLAHGHGYSVGLSASGTTLTLNGSAIRMTLLGANPAAQGRGQQELPGTVGYVGAGGGQPALASIPTYAAVRFSAVYPGVDLVYYGRRGRLEYDLRLAPGADPRRIRLAFPGADTRTIAPDGDLVLHGAAGTVREQRPVIYQVIGGTRRPVGGGYVLSGGTVGIRVGPPYDRHAPLVIDPVLVYSTYFGGSGDDRATGITVDGHGNIYIVGTTTSGSQTSFAFAARLDPTGRHVAYLKYIGNRYGAGHTSDQAECNSTGNGITVDPRGNAYVTGLYGDIDPGLDTHLCSVKVVLWARISPAGKTTVDIFGKYSTSQGNAIAVDGQGNSYITGSTDQWAANFPVTRGAFQTTAGISKEQEGVAGDAFVLKVDPSGAVVYGTFLGGSGIDEGNGIAVDGQGNAYVVGTSGIDIVTGYIDFPRTRNAIQLRPGNPYAAGFLSVLSADGSRLLYSTYLSGKQGEVLSGVAVDGQGYTYVVGSSDSDNFPTTPNAYKRTCGTDALCNPQNTCYHDYSDGNNYCHVAVTEDVVVAKIDPRQSGAAGLLYSTYIGGRNRDLGTAIAVDGNGITYITGRTASIGEFPTVHAVQGALGGDYDAFVAAVDTNRSGDASLLFSTYLGGSGYDEGDGIALDGRGSVYVAGYTGSRTDFPTRNASQGANAGGYDAFVTRIGGVGR